MTGSSLVETLSRVAGGTASSVVARGRIASPALNAALLRRLSAEPGEADAFVADPVFEAASVWESAGICMDDLSGNLLHPDLVSALDEAEEERIPRERQPWTHQLASWRATREGFSCLVSSGTGSGKTECFMVPMLDDLLRNPDTGLLYGVRAIVIYPLNALIESQRTRLAAWTAPMKDRLKFALYNGLTPETPREEHRSRLAAAEIGNRRAIRSSPPSILVTNVTMLEYLLLRAQDRPILESSQGLLRWVVLDEVHGYVGAQAAEMALLLRRVRAAFGVEPNQVRLIATSATIGEGPGTEEKLKRFACDLAGIREDRVRVIQGRVVEPELPSPVTDSPLKPDSLVGQNDVELWARLGPHPRIQKLKREMSEKSVSFSDAEKILFGPNGGRTKSDTQSVLDAAARAQCPETGARLLPWRAHIFHRSQGGIWVCVDPSCKHRDAELTAEDSGWRFGAAWLRQRDTCRCDAPVFELFTCKECGTPHLVAGRLIGVMARLIPVRSLDMDDYAVDAEPDSDEGEADFITQDKVMLLPSSGNQDDCFLKLEDGTVLDNEPPAGGRWVRVELKEEEMSRGCCPGAHRIGLGPQRYGPPFLMGSGLPGTLESLARPYGQPGRPMAGKRALTFSDSRQGTARLAAKLQQDAERSLTRAFLYHAVQEGERVEGEDRRALERRLEVFRTAPEAFADDIREVERILEGGSKPVPWRELVSRFAQQNELCAFATQVWRERAGGGREMGDDPSKLAEMFLYRELLRRPKVQNNAETMGLVQLCFPGLQERANARVPHIVAEAGIGPSGWVALALAAIDFLFRDRLAVRLASLWMMRFVSPRSRGHPRSICSSAVGRADRPASSQSWPTAVSGGGRPSRLVRLAFAMMRGRLENRTDQDRVEELLSELWMLITSTVAKDIGAGAFQVDFEKAAVARLDDGWVCPVTRRIIGYSPDGRSPYDPEQMLEPVSLPRLPTANPGGLNADDRREMELWCRTESSVIELRKQGLWTDFHDRAAAYAPFLRAQEHSAQIERPVLAYYEELFKEGKINLLNCSTTMEMGVDIPNVELVTNSNVPPSISNYRQRLGRAGRRGEPWAFGITYCRELPLDRIVFDAPRRFLAGTVSAPAVRLDSPGLVARHVQAALLGTFLRGLTEGFDLRASTGAFFGATDDADNPVVRGSTADAFLDALQGEWSRSAVVATTLMHLTRGTVFEGGDTSYLCARSARAFERILLRWRNEYRELLVRRDAAAELEVKTAFAIRARRMKGEFLLAELARRGFTPAYGFPVDVVAFDHLSGHDREQDSGLIEFGERRGGASRTLDIAIREYAPGTDIVVDGLVHRSEGVMPAWGAMADASKLEDLQSFWECRSCLGFGLTRVEPESCPQCDTPGPRWHRTLRPAGFLGRHAPHTGYESLGHVAYEMPRLSASGSSWRSLPDPLAGRWRADPRGRVVTFSSGPGGRGYSLCLECGRAEPETGYPGEGRPLPGSMERHYPLAPSRKGRERGGFCSGGFTDPERVQRYVRFIHEARTDVFELQLAAGTTQSEALALGAGLREALTQRLGAEGREIGIAVGSSKGPTNEARVSAFLHDRASGGAGLSSRLSEQEWFSSCVERACIQLDCPEDCSHGCPACVLRPDLNFGEELLDRVGGLRLARELQANLELPDRLRIFGPGSRLLDVPLPLWLDRMRRRLNLVAVTIFVHGAPEEWEFAEWPVGEVFSRLHESGVKLTTVLKQSTLVDKGMTLGQKLDIHRLSAYSLLASLEELPEQGSIPVLAVVEEARGATAVAAGATEETRPGPAWGLGEQAALIRGPAQAVGPASHFSTEELIKVSTGNARIIRAGAKLNGRVGAFGQAFWKLLKSECPLTVAALREHGVEAAVYVDRYLVTPLVLRLLAEVVRKMPGKNRTRLNISTARLFRKEQQGWAVFHSFSEDDVRGAVLEELLPGARIRIVDKATIPHERRLTLTTGDGRRVVIFLDQGFGAWRARGVPRHDFAATPRRQALSLKSLKFSVLSEPGRQIPIVVEEGGS